MRKTGTLLITAFIAAMMAACGGTAENKPANTSNANTGAVGPPTVETFKALETKAFEAYMNKDTKYFETFLDRNFVMYEKGQKVDRAAAIKMIGEHKDEIKGFTFSDEKMTKVGPVTAVFTAKVVTDGTRDGKKIPDVVASTVYVRQGTDWRAAWHGEVEIKTPPAATDRATAANTAKANPTGAAPAKTDDNAKADDKKPAAPAKEPAKPADTKPANSAANSAAAPAADATAALLALEKTGWETWKAKDWTKLGGMMTADVAFIDPMGGVTAGKDAVIKGWTDMNCDVKSVSVTDGSSVSVTGDTSILFAKGNADAKCGDMKLGPVWVTAVYVKEGADWKLAYHFEQPAE